MEKKVYISGMHSGQNPCSGVGLARSIRKAFPDMRIVGVDHWQGASGLHDASVDETLILPQWAQLDDDRHSSNVKAILDEGHLWLSAMDREVHWLSENVGPHRNLLAPGGPAIASTAKPAVQAFGRTDFKVPEFISASLPDSEIHTFLRHNSWQCWLKSPFHDAKRVTSWSSFVQARAAMGKSWKTSRLFVQRNVIGNEETISFAAYQGELLGAAHLEKRLLTPEGKTWAGKVTRVEPELYEQLREIIQGLEWSGGGELEYVRDPDGQRWIIECNPRFPAWIYGAAIAGMNLPAKVVSRAWGLPFLESVAHYPFFTRVVQEIPAKEAIGVPLPPDPASMTWMADGKKGKGMYHPSQAVRLNEDQDQKELEAGAAEEVIEQVPEAYFDEIQRISAVFEGETPNRIHLEEWTHARFRSIAAKVRDSGQEGPEIRIGYSIKTSPTNEHLTKAKGLGFFAECISQAEVKRAVAFGFQPSEVILNGPGKFWPLTQPPVMGLHMLFCDSIEEFDRVLVTPSMAKVLGFRMRLPMIHSRFGNALDDFENFQRIATSVRKLKGKSDLGFHFHMPSWAIGVQRWSEALQSLILWCQVLERLTGVPVKRLDLGGGFFPMDLEGLDFQSVRKTVAASLPWVEAIYFEPGRSLTQDGEILVSRVLDVRRTPDGDLLEVVVDACVAELPLALSYNHRIFFRGKDGKCEFMRKGPVRVLGRICMEDDILSGGLDLPDAVEVGDLVIFGDAGGYERSMSYVFGRG